MINLGDEVKDTVSGFKGIAVARYSYLQGCTRVCVQPPIDKDGKLPETAVFDEPLLEATGKKKIKPIIDKKNPGGPDKYPDTGRHDG